LRASARGDEAADLARAVPPAEASGAIGGDQPIAECLDLQAEPAGRGQQPVAVLARMQPGERRPAERGERRAEGVERAFDHDRGGARERGHQPHGAVGIAPPIGTVHLPGAVREQAQIADRGGLDVADHRLVAAEMVERRHQRRDRGGRGDVIDRDERRGSQHRGASPGAPEGRGEAIASIALPNPSRWLCYPPFCRDDKGSGAKKEAASPTGMPPA
jgi:hypothetical protein